MAASRPNLHTMVHRRACTQGVLKVKVQVKGHVIRALSSCHENRFFSRAMARSPPNFHKKVPRRACTQDVLKVKVEIKGHVIRALYCLNLGMSYSVIDGLVSSFHNGMS